MSPLESEGGTLDHEPISRLKPVYSRHTKTSELKTLLTRMYSAAFTQVIKIKVRCNMLTFLPASRAIPRPAHAVHVKLLHRP